MVTALASVALAACSSTPAGLGHRTQLAHLTITNAQRWPFTLFAVVGDHCLECARSPGAATASFDMLPGAYVLRAMLPAGELALPVPLVEPALVASRTLQLTLEAPPPVADAGTDADAFAFVPAGPALIGDELGVGQEDERPPRIVDVPMFWLGCCEVTNAEYVAFLNAITPTIDPMWCAFDSKKCRLLRSDDGRTWTTPEPRQPVVTISLAGARAYCDWRTRATGMRHRLPHEIEWEKAARGPESFTFAYGNTYRRTAANQESGSLHDVARHPPNGWGLFDMTGNAFEWTDDAYAAAGAGRVGARATDAPFQILRGGSFVLDGMYLRNSFRMRQRPDVRTDDIGFRVVREAAPTPE